MARRRILITGGAGYIGAHAAVHFLQTKCTVSVIDNLSSGRREALQRVQQITAKHLDFHHVDLLDLAATTQAIRASYPDVVVHLAGSKSVAASVADPQAFRINNVQTTENLIAAMADTGVRKVIFASTASVYGEPQSDLAVGEHSELSPQSPYARDKIACEHLLNNFARTHNASVIHLRFFNVAGALASGLLGESTDPPTNLLPMLMAQTCQKAPEVTIYGTDWPTPDGTCIRDYVHIDDVVRGISLAIDHTPRMVGSDVFNLGTAQGSSVLEVIAAVQAASGRSFTVKHGPRRPGDPGRYTADATKAARVLGWKPRWSLNDMAVHAFRWQQHRNRR